YITIGNFFEPGNYDIEIIPPGCSQPNFGYYYIEDLRVELTQTQGTLELEAEICEGDCYIYQGDQYCSPGVYQIPIDEVCYNLAILTITPGDSTTAVIEEPDELECDDISIFLDASGSSSGPGITYQWSGPNGYNSTEQNPEVTDPGVYTLTVSSGILCPAETSVEVFEELIPPDISAEVDGNIDCNNLPVDLIGSSETPNVTFNWFGPGVDVNSQNATTTQAGTYTFTVTTIGGCTTSEQIIVEADYETPDLTAEVDGIIDCNNPISTLNGSSNTPGVTFHWEGPGVDENTQTATATQSGDFTLTVTAPNGCTSSQTVVVNDDFDEPDIFAEVIGTLDCNTSSVTLSGGSVTPGSTFQWLGENVNTNDPLTSASQPGLYIFTVTAPNGCTSILDIFVADESDPPDI